MRNLNQHTITEAVLERHANTADPRLAQIMTGLVRHLHEFAREVALTEDEWFKRRFVSFDMAHAAEQSGSVISAVLFGALSGTGVLPFSRSQFEATIERGGVGVKPMKPHLAHRLVSRFTRSGRVVSTSSLGGYLPLYTLARWRVGRRSTLRFAMETERIEDWLQRVASAARTNPALGLEVAQCQRLVKGYGDAHARGYKNYQTLTGVVQRKRGMLAPATLRDLRSAALADEHGHKLRESLARLALA
ncbi:MAG: DUF6537 domain-containing protein [Caldimonas sp.]